MVIKDQLQFDKVEIIIIFRVLLKKSGKVRWKWSGNCMIIEGPREPSSIIISYIEEENVEIIFTNCGDILQGWRRIPEILIIFILELLERFVIEEEIILFDEIGVKNVVLVRV